MNTLTTSRKKRSVLLMVILVIAVLFALLTALTLANQSQQISRNPAEVLSQVNGRVLPNERPPRDDLVAAKAAGVPLTASIDEFNAAVSDWYADFYQKKEKSGPNPLAYDVRMAALEAAELDGRSPMAASVSLTGTAEMLMIPFDFTGTDEIPGCDITGTQTFTATVTGPLSGAIPDPAPEGDNNSIYAPNGDFTIGWYEELMFGNGITTPIRTDLNGGAGVDLTGVSATNWYQEQSEGVYSLAGDIYPNWIQLDHSVAYYGWDADEEDPDGRGVPCNGTPSGYGFEFVIDIADKINADDPGFDWSQYDVSGPGDQGPPDGIVDHLMVIHSGMDNSAGGGTYGNYQLWAHSSDVRCDENGDGNLTIGCRVQGEDTPADPSDDIYISNYTLIPEDADIGVVVHEFGHDIGLPDYYDQTGATSNSTAHWIAMSGGSWSGELGGSHPAPFNPWGRYFFGWEDPLRVSYTDTVTVDIGQSEPTPLGTEDSVWIDLPDKEVVVDNKAGTGKGLHSILGNNLDSSLQKDFDLGGTTNPILTFDTYYEIEEDWDYTYIRASTDGGSNWTVLLNEEGEYATTDPNGTFTWRGPGGLTGSYDGVLTYDLSAYAGQPSVLFEFLYTTDAAVQDPGIWIDNISLDDGAANLYTQDFEGSYSDWIDVDSGWEEVPYNETFKQYYMLEWRNDSGSIAQKGQLYQYYSLAHAQDGWLVDKFPANVPGLLVWYRNTFYNNNQAVAGGREFASPATGPKGELLLVDSHYDPIPWSGGWWDVGQLSNRRGAMDGSLSLADVPAWNIHDEADSANAVMDFGSRGAITAFHDSMRSVPGWIFPGDGFVYRADRSASVVIPASDDYTTRIRDLDGNGNPGNDVYGLWGFTVGGQELGSGNPGDSGAQYGVHVALTDIAVDGSQATVEIWNSATFVEVETDINAPFPGGTANYTAVVTNTSPFTETFDFEFYVEYPDGSDETVTATVTLASGDTYNENLSDGVAMGTAIGTELYAEAQVSIPSQNFEDVSQTLTEVTSPLAKSTVTDDAMGDPVSAGDEISYTVTITNSENRVIDGFVYVAIPENATYVGGSAYGGLTPVSMSQAAVQELVVNGGLAALNQVAAVGAVSALIAPVNIPANGTLADMGFAVTVNAGELDGSVDVAVKVYETGYATSLVALPNSVGIEPVSTIFLPFIAKD